MRRLAYITLLIIIGLSLMACDEDGELRIRNRTNALAWASVDGATPVELLPWTAWSKFYSSDTVVQVAFNGNHVFARTENLNVYVGLPTSLNINASGGAVNLSNTGAQNITEVFISPSDSLSWGNNVLADAMIPNTSALWTCTAGNWDMKLTLANGTNLYKFGQVITLDQTSNITLADFTPTRKSDKLSGEWIATDKTRIELKSGL